MLKKSVLITFLIIFSLSMLFSQEDTRGEKIQGGIFKNDAMGLSLRLPDGEWYAKDSSQGLARVFTLTNPDWKDFYLTLVMMPSAIGIRTADDRNLQLSNYFAEKYEKIDIKKGNIGGRDTDVLIYNYKGDKANQTNLTHVIVIGDQTYLFQLTGPESDWDKDPQKREDLFSGISFFERKMVEMREEKTGTEEEKTPEPEVIKAKAKIKHHSLELDIDPVTGKFNVLDKFSAEMIGNDVKQVEFYLSDMDVDSIKINGRDVEYSLEPLQDGTKKLVIDLDKTYNAGETVALDYAAHKDNFLFTNSGKLIAGYNIFGQVRKDSCYTSHVLYYPIDEENATSGEVWITVPKGYQAISVGKLAEKKSECEKVTFHWKTDIAIPRMLPFAFAAAEYERYSAESESGVQVEVYTWKTYEKQALERVDVIRDIIDFESRLYGKFPFEKIAFIHVMPKEGLAGVSLPTMILLSDMFFKSNVSYEVIKESVQGSMTGPLVLADEMSHQWNAYAVVFPNELAEGMAQYTDTLFAEHVGGKDVLKKHMEYYLGLYKAAVAVHRDSPIASKEVYRTEAYSSIAFCKGAMVLNMLRYVVGDDLFFQAFRTVFETNFGKKAGFDTLKEGMEAAYGRSLDWFFDQWYHRAGFPRYEVTLKKSRMPTGKWEAAVLIKQTQKGAFFKMPVDITFVSGDSEKTFERVMLDAGQKRVAFELDFDPQKVIVDKDMWLLKEAVYK